MKAPLP